MAEPVDLEEAGEILPLHADEGPIGFQPYVLDLQGMGHGSATVQKCLAIAVMVREDGLLLALPELALLGEVLGAGMQAGPLELIGPHTRVEVPAASMDEVAINADPVVSENQAVTAIVVDFSAGVLPFLKAADNEDLIDIMAFDVLDSLLVPSPADLVQKALVWAQSMESSDRLQFYSADEAGDPAPPSSPRPKPATRRRATASGGPPGGGRSGSAPRRKPTVANLAESLEEIAKVLPSVTTQLQDLTERTTAIEAHMSKPPDRTSALRKPLGSFNTDGSGSPSRLRSLVASMPPPKGISPQAKHRVSFGPQETAEISEEFAEGRSDLAQAMIAQSQALTALVAQIANNSGDPLQDLSAVGSTLSSRGSLGRARLQSELAAHKGVFFQSVLQSMSRRMFPTQPAEVEMSVLQSRGVSPSLYLERFGGFGRTRDLGFIIWQVALCMNFLQEDNVPAAKDAISLLFVCLEQSAMDGGKMDVGLLLALVEDPPQTLFTGRSLAAGSTPRPFAPTANQKWVTTALQYLKELDTISTRRAEATSNKSGPSETAGSNPSPNPRPKAKKGAGKGAAKAKAAANQHQEEET